MDHSEQGRPTRSHARGMSSARRLALVAPSAKRSTFTGCQPRATVSVMAASCRSTGQPSSAIWRPRRSSSRLRRSSSKRRSRAYGSPCASCSVRSSCANSDGPRGTATLSTAGSPSAVTAWATYANCPPVRVRPALMPQSASRLATRAGSSFSQRSPTAPKYAAAAWSSSLTSIVAMTDILGRSAAPDPARRPGGVDQPGSSSRAESFVQARCFRSHPTEAR